MTKLEKITKGYADIFSRDYGDIELMDHEHPKYRQFLEQSNLLNQLLELAYADSLERRGVKNA